jgi:hypothetical protein
MFLTVGIGLTHCDRFLQDDDHVNAYAMPAYKDYLSGSPFCIQCCGSNPDKIDNWNFACEANSGGQPVTTNYQTLNFKFAQRKTFTDKSTVTCSFDRTMCAAYNETDQTCVQDTYLHGYTLTIHLTEYNSNFVSYSSLSLNLQESK